MQRMIDTATWDDPWFADLAPDAKLLFLYLLTNRRSTAAGAFEITIRAMAFETGIDAQRVDAILAELHPRVRWWADLNVVWIRNFFRHQAANENFRKSATTFIAGMPRIVQETIACVYPDLVPAGVVCESIHGETGSETHGEPMPTGSDTPSLVIDRDRAESKSNEEEMELDGASAPEPPSPPDDPQPQPKRKRATSIPEDFAVSEQVAEWGDEHGFTQSQLESQVPQFVDFYTAKGETRRDWDASFRTWMRNAREWGHLREKPDGSLRIVTNGRPSGADISRASINELRREMGIAPQAPNDDVIDTTFRRTS